MECAEVRGYRNVDTEGGVRVRCRIGGVWASA